MAVALHGLTLERRQSVRQALALHGFPSEAKQLNLGTARARTGEWRPLLILR